MSGPWAQVASHKVADHTRRVSSSRAHVWGARGLGGGRWGLQSWGQSQQGHLAAGEAEVH